MAHPKQPTVNQDQIARFKAGDSEALNQLYMEAKPRLLAIYRQFTKEESVAEDLLQIVIMVDVILSSFTPLVPRQESAKSKRANNLVYRIEWNSPTVRLKFVRIPCF